ncbi:MAG: type II CAAX endopeptidase family protein [Myxococcota bacterium]|jgi:membrane protease YdiL (CAAX protease family)|nr:type II CAAX endopeptidase family protein [Myxococcota bacterium]
MNGNESRYKPHMPPGQSNRVDRHFPGPLAALGITLGAVFAAGLVAGLFGPTINFGAIGVGQVVGFGLVAIYATQRIAQPHAERLGLRGFDRDMLPVLVFLLPSVFLFSEVDNLLRDWFPPVPTGADAEVESNPLFAPTLYGEIQRFIVIVGLAPVMEEWLFRGVIQQGLMGNLGRWRGLILTALLFAVCRIVPGLPPSTLLSFLLVSFATGLLLGCVRVATGSLLAAIVLHTGFNLIGWGAAFYKDSFPIQGFNVADSHTSFQLLFASLITTGFALQALIRALKVAPADPPLGGGKADA